MGYSLVCPNLWASYVDMSPLLIEQWNGTDIQDWRTIKQSCLLSRLLSNLITIELFPEGNSGIIWVWHRGCSYNWSGPFSQAWDWNCARISLSSHFVFSSTNTLPRSCCLSVYFTSTVSVISAVLTFVYIFCFLFYSFGRKEEGECMTVLRDDSQLCIEGSVLMGSETHIGYQ